VICDAGPVAAIRQPTGPAHYQVGEVTLADGTAFEVWGDDNGKGFLKNVRTGDRVEICFGPTRRWADEGPDVRPAFAVGVRTGDTYTSVGIPGKNALTFPPRGNVELRRPTAP